MRGWCVVVDDPDAWRAHVLVLHAEDPKEAERIGAIAATHADFGLSAALVQLAPAAEHATGWRAHRTSIEDYAVAFPMRDDLIHLDQHSHDWPLGAGNTPLQFVIPDGALVAYDPLQIAALEAEDNGRTG